VDNQDYRHDEITHSHVLRGTHVGCSVGDMDTNDTTTTQPERDGMGLDTTESLNSETLAEVEFEEACAEARRAAQGVAQAVTADHPAIQAAMERKRARAAR
jgi:hypothetical protein